MLIFFMIFQRTFQRHESLRCRHVLYLAEGFPELAEKARVEWVEECRMTQEMIQANLMGLKSRVARDQQHYNPLFNDFIRETRRKAQKRARVPRPVTPRSPGAPSRIITRGPGAPDCAPPPKMRHLEPEVRLKVGPEPKVTTDDTSSRLLMSSNELLK